MRVSRILQQSLLVRTSAVFLSAFLITGLFVDSLLHSAIFFRLFPGVLERHAVATSELVFLIESVPEDATQIVLSAYSGPTRLAYIGATFPQGAKASPAMSEPFRDASHSAAYDLSSRELRFRTVRSREVSRLIEEYNLGNVIGRSGLEVSIELNDGRILSILLTPTAIAGSYGLPVFALFIFSLTIASLISLALLFRPLKKLETATLNIGQTSKPQLIEESGTEDVRRVARALNKVQVRVAQLLSERSRMVAALAHDVRTSLTHMKLRLDDAEELDLKALQEDIGAMEDLIGDMLLYAKSENAAPRTELINLGAHLEATLETVPYAVDFVLAKDEFQIAADPVAIRRAVLNILQNGHDYGEKPNISTVSDQTGYTIIIEDYGPGIPEAELEKVFDAFYRMDPSRSRSTGGSGLGLTIAKSLLSAQGATLSLSNVESGGLRVAINFPPDTKIT